jgi:hypothetical protein
MATCCINNGVDTKALFIYTYLKKARSYHWRWTGVSTGLVNNIPSVAELVSRIAPDAEKIETFEKCSILFKFKAGDPPQAD